MIHTSLVNADALRTALAAIREQPPAQIPGFTRRAGEALGQLPLDATFIDRCRKAIVNLVGLENGGVIEVTSARRREGRTSVAAAVAMALARDRDVNVLLLELDFEQPHLAELFSVAAKPGLADFLDGRERLRAIRGGPRRQLWMVPAGSHGGDVARFFHVVAREELLAVFRERFHWVVVDLPPLLVSPESIAVASQADWDLLVGRHRRTAIADLRDVVELLGADRRSGFLLTADVSRVPGWVRRLVSAY